MMSEDMMRRFDEMEARAQAAMMGPCRHGVVPEPADVYGRSCLIRESGQIEVGCNCVVRWTAAERAFIDAAKRAARAARRHKLDSKIVQQLVLAERNMQAVRRGRPKPERSK